jgi:hypothetical protein
LKKNYLKYHQLNDIRKDKWNLVLYKLNSKANFHQNTILLKDEKIATQIITNHKLEFFRLLQDHNMLNIRKVDMHEHHIKYENQVKKGLELITTICEEHYDDKNSEEVIANYFEKGLKILTEGDEKQENVEKHRKKRVMKELFADVDLFLQNQQKAGFYIDYLDDLLVKEVAKPPQRRLKLNHTRSLDTYKNPILKYILICCLQC